MSLTAPLPTKSDRKPIPAGLTVARCYLIADLGLQKTTWQGEDKVKHKVQISFELPKHRMEYEKDGEKHEGPRVIGQRYTLSMHPKAILRKTIQSWFGKAFPSDQAAASFDIEKLIGKVCMINIIHNEKDGTTYANIDSLSPLMEGVEVPPAELDPVVYTSDHPEALTKLPEWMQNIIAQQVRQPTAQLPQEAAHAANTGPTDPGPQFGDNIKNASGVTVADFDDDIPF